MDINTLGIASVAAITVVCYLVGLMVKLIPATNNRLIPVTCGLSPGPSSASFGILGSGWTIRLRSRSAQRQLGSSPA